MEVKINCAQYKTAPLSTLKILQGDLKDLSDSNFEKLKTQILDEGFISPFFVWIKDNERWLVDGTQRFRTLTKMKDQGIKMPDDFPIHEVYADTYRDACKRVLALSSQYGTLTKQGLYEFVEKNDLKDDLDTFHFDAFKMEDFNIEFYDSVDEMDLDEVEKEEAPAKFILQVNLPNELELRDLYDDLISKGYIVKEL
jgi:hypothetical protein